MATMARKAIALAVFLNCLQVLNVNAQDNVVTDLTLEKPWETTVYRSVPTVSAGYLVTGIWLRPSTAAINTDHLYLKLAAPENLNKYCVIISTRNGRFYADSVMSPKNRIFGNYKVNLAQISKEIIKYSVLSTYNVSALAVQGGDCYVNEGVLLVPIKTSINNNTLEVHLRLGNAREVGVTLRREGGAFIMKCEIPPGGNLVLFNYICRTDLRQLHVKSGVWSLEVELHPVGGYPTFYEYKILL